jgi:2-methylcitrate dehydratase PrpD
MGFDAKRTRDALGIAEYFGPRGQIMRVCEFPTMVKDGSGWGAHVGLTAAQLAREGFTGAPALTVEHDHANACWADLARAGGSASSISRLIRFADGRSRRSRPRWRCKRTHRFNRRGDCRSRDRQLWRSSGAWLGMRAPQTTEDAQYSLPFPVAAALVFGSLGAAEINAPALRDPRSHPAIVIDGAAATMPDFSRRFPAERMGARAHRVDELAQTLVSEPTRARGNPENPLADDELQNKYRALTEPVLGGARTRRIEQAIASLTTDRTALPALIAELLQAASDRPGTH